MLHFPENLVAVHPTEDEEQYEAVAEGEEEIVVIAEEGLETITYGVDNATEVDAFANHVGGNGIHAVPLQPLQTATPFQHVDDVIEECQEQVAVAARYECH